MPMNQESTLLAVMRPVSAAMVACELTHVPRTAIDIDLARRQHEAYERALIRLGCRIERLAEEPSLADSVFVEDTAIVLDEVAVITRPGALSRRPEIPSIAAALGTHRHLEHIHAPGTLDGGDVLRVGRTVYVGLSTRSNAAAIEQLGALLARRGYRVEGVPLGGCLHLKSAVTQVGPQLLLINPAYVERHRFADMQFVEVDPGEPFAANALLIGQEIIYPASNPRTAQRLRQRGVTVHTVDVSELEKAEGAVTCCSLIFSA